MNRLEVRTRILSALNESADSPVFYSNDQLNQTIDESYELLCEEAEVIKRTAYIGLKPGTTYYYTKSIADDMIVPYRIWNKSTQRVLPPLTMLELDSQDIRWTQTTGDPWYWFPYSFDIFGIYPHPTTGGGLLRIDYIAWPQGILDDDSLSEFTSEDDDASVLYGVYDGLLKMWDLDRAMVIFAKFLEKLGNTQANNGVKRIDSKIFHREPGLSIPSGMVR